MHQRARNIESAKKNSESRMTTEVRKTENQLHEKESDTSQGTARSPEQTRATSSHKPALDATIFVWELPGNSTRPVETLEDDMRSGATK